MTENLLKKSGAPCVTTATDCSADITCSSSTSSSCCPPAQDTQTEFLFLKKVFSAAGRNMHKTKLPALVLVQRCANLMSNNSRRSQVNNSNQNGRSKRAQNTNAGYGYLPGIPPQWFTLTPYQQLEHARMMAYQQYNSYPRPTFQPHGPYPRGPRTNTRNMSGYPQTFATAGGYNHTVNNVGPSKEGFSRIQHQRTPNRTYNRIGASSALSNSECNQTLPIVAKLAPTHPNNLQGKVNRAQFPQPYAALTHAVQSFPSASSPSNNPIPQFCTAVAAPITQPVPALIGSVGSRDSQLLLHQQYAQNYYQTCAQQYAEVYAQQYAQQYVRILAQQQQQATYASQTAPLSPFKESIYPASSQELYTCTATGPELQKQPRGFHSTITAPHGTSSEVRAPRTPLATVAAQIAQRPHGTTFHFAITPQSS